MSWSGDGSPGGPFVTPPPAWGDDPTRAPRGRSSRQDDGRSSGSVLVATVIAVSLIVIAGAALLVFGGPDEQALPPALDPSATFDVPPSERDQPTAGAEPDTRDPATGPPVVDEGYTSLDCVFVGTALVEPAVGHEARGPHRMQLDDTSGFECVDEDGLAAGAVTLDVGFERLDLFAGTGRGSGGIDWSSVPADRLAPGALVPGASTTDTEVELALPQIIVWITVLDGPYEGFRGRLVLEDWDLRQRPELDRTDVVFAPTGFGLGPRT